MNAVSALALLGTAAAAPQFAAKSGNMNGNYAVTSGGDVGVEWNDDYASKGYEFFDVWAPEIATHYGEVFWTDQGPFRTVQYSLERFRTVRPWSELL